MSFHSHTKKTFVARRVFTDRIEPIALFERALVAPQERDHHRVICWHGVGGQGKTRLRQEICRRTANQKNVALASLDFDEPRNLKLVNAMLKLRGDLAGRGLSFPAFDLTFARHFALERPGENIREVYPQLYRKGESEIVDDLIDWSETAIDAAVDGISLVVPGLNLLYKYSHRLSGRIADWLGSKAVIDQLKGLDQLSTPQLSERLPLYLGFDIWQALEDDSCPRIIITIDSHEKLGGGELRGDIWLQTLVRETPGALILMFGRDKLRWTELNESWLDVLDQHFLGELSNNDANAFLTNVPIKEAEVRAHIIKASKGLPHYLDLSVTMYENIINSGQIPVVDNFGTTPAEVRERFLEHLPHDERDELLLASYPETLSERLFNDLAETFLGGAGHVNWTRLARRSFMSSVNGRLVMHGLMREALQEQEQVERLEFFVRVHENLFERYATRARVTNSVSVTPNSEIALLAAAFHASRLGRDNLLNWIKEVSAHYRQAARLHLLIDLYEGALHHFPEKSIDRAWLVHELADVQQAMGHYAEAEKLCKEAQMIYKGHFGEKHANYAITLHELGIIRHDMGHFAEAESLYKQALLIFEHASGKNSSYCLMALHELARVRQDLGQYAEAETLYKRALSIIKISPGKKHLNYAITLHELARVRHAMSYYVEAESIYRQALKIIKTSLGKKNHYYATNLHELARVLQDLGHFAEAESLYEQALNNFKSTLGDKHPSTILCMASLAGCNAISGKFEVARQRIAQSLNYAAYLPVGSILMRGRVHLKWAQGLAGADLTQEALGEARSAAELLEKSLGPEAAHTAQAWKLMDDLNEE